MVNYSCEKCGKEFSQKGHYTKHLNKKNPCVVESKVKEMLDKVVEEKLNKLKIYEIDKDLQEFIKCDVFTPDDISKLMASKLNNKGNLLEPSVGIGNLLKYINLEKYEYVDIYEIKKDYLDSISFNKKINIYNCDFIKKQIDTTYDNIIMNPPYIKMQDLSEDYREYLKEKYDILKDGIIDIYYAFIIKCLNLLKNDGVLVSITPNSYLYNKSSLKLRKYLFDNKYIKEIIDFNDNKVFQNVSVYCCITIFTKTDKQNIIYNNKNILYTDIIKNYSLFNTTNNDKLKIKDICKITNGIATLRDKIYIHDEKLFEEPCWKPIINCKTKRFIIYPYNEGIIMDEDTFRKENSLTYNHLLSYKDELSKRDKGNNTYPKWYSYGRTQSLKYSNKKCIYIPCFLNPELINEEITINSNILHSGCLRIEPHKEEDIQTIINLIVKNKEFIKLNSSKRSGGWININSSTIYNIEL